MSQYIPKTNSFIVPSQNMGASNIRQLNPVANPVSTVVVTAGTGAAGYMLWQSRKKNPAWWKTGLVVLLGPAAWLGAFVSSNKKD